MRTRDNIEKEITLWNEAPVSPCVYLRYAVATYNHSPAHKHTAHTWEKEEKKHVPMQLEESCINCKAWNEEKRIKLVQ